jgi:hypothetical protein
MKTNTELQKENADLKRMNERLKNRLTKALKQAANNHERRGESHHRAFEQLCPMPPFDKLTVKIQ